MYVSCIQSNEINLVFHSLHFINSFKKAVKNAIKKERLLWRTQKVLTK